MRTLFFVSFIWTLWSSALALELTGHIQWNEHCPSIRDLGQAIVVLDNGRIQSGITRDGGFLMPDVPPGTYILSVVAHDHIFEKLRLDVLESDSLPEVRPYIPGTPLSPASPMTLPYPITLSAVQKIDFYMPRQAFNLIGMFKNPMMMMMLVGGALVFAMPYIMKNMDPEVLQDFEKRQAKITNIQSSLQSGDLKSGLSALMAAGDEDATAASGKQTPETKQPSGVRHRNGKNKKR